MARPSVIPEIEARLREYLNGLDSAYRSDTTLNRNPTLPCTPDGKVNVRAIAQAIGLRTTQEKYLYERDELSQPINHLAEHQDLLPIGSRVNPNARFEPFKERLAHQARAAEAAVQAAIEAQAAQSELLEQLKGAAAEIEALRAENTRLRAQLEAVHTGLFVRIEP
jgi:hypothetical protein